ncbi:isoflavone 3'-hydroxylase [Senna tora]|uniref:Isoflavone 3'-hydroxylase n=1 Tax=Senna tora TaxID=362788 RepID=A0A834T3I1_9FABA|nr:isoflavone 3'-hydroxylase [Senna tora]
MSLRFGALNVLVISTPFAVEECLVKKNDIVFAKRPYACWEISVMITNPWLPFFYNDLGKMDLAAVGHYYYC